MHRFAHQQESQEAGDDVRRFEIAGPLEATSSFGGDGRITTGIVESAKTGLDELVRSGYMDDPFRYLKMIWSFCGI